MYIGIKSEWRYFDRKHWTMPQTRHKNERIIIITKKERRSVQVGVREKCRERGERKRRRELQKVAFFCASANLCLQLFNASFVCPNSQPCPLIVRVCVCVCGCYAKMPACISVSGQCNGVAGTAYGYMAVWLFGCMAAHVRRPRRPCSRCRRCRFAFCLLC